MLWLANPSEELLRESIMLKRICVASIPGVGRLVLSGSTLISSKPMQAVIIDATMRLQTVCLRNFMVFPVRS